MKLRVQKWGGGDDVCDLGDFNMTKQNNTNKTKQIAFFMLEIDNETMGENRHGENKNLLLTFHPIVISHKLLQTLWYALSFDLILNGR